LRILKGHLPSSELLARFPPLAQLYQPLIDAILKGDIIAYDKALETSSSQLLRLNLYLILERARELCIRGLFRRV
jgi:COP9 signalosome complex subunit 12